MSSAVTQTRLKHGDFTGLAANYALYRPAYAPSVLRALLALLAKPPAAIDAADIGAGTGIWTRMMAPLVRHVAAVEPNDDMRMHGESACAGLRISYLRGTGESTGLHTASVDLVSAASCFHWMELEPTLREFHRILRPQGRFVALWNARLIADDGIHAEIEAKIAELAPDVTRVSSGASGITATLTERLLDSGLFEDVVYLEGRHVETRTSAQYVGVWESVNDVRVQLGEARWRAFMDFVAKRVAGMPRIDTTYRTRAWSALRR
jgi:SAM-dependent methyltransferase